MNNVENGVVLWSLGFGCLSDLIDVSMLNLNA